MVMEGRRWAVWVMQCKYGGMGDAVQCNGQ